MSRKILIHFTKEMNSILNLAKSQMLCTLTKTLHFLIAASIVLLPDRLVSFARMTPCG